VSVSSGNGLRLPGVFTAAAPIALGPALPLKVQGLRDCVTNYANGLDHVLPGLGHALRRHPLHVKKVDDQRGLVLGAGVGTTATRALNEALKLLGLNSKHYLEVGSWTLELVQALGGTEPHGPMMLDPYSVEDARQCLNALRQFDFTSLPGHIDAILDQPVPELFLDLFLSFPKAKVILTTRPAKDWVASRTSKYRLNNGTLLPIQEPCGLTLPVALPLLGRHGLATVFELHNNLVRCVVPKERIFEIDVFTKSQDGLMRQLAEFLGLLVWQPN